MFERNFAKLVAPLSNIKPNYLVHLKGQPVKWPLKQRERDSRKNSPDKDWQTICGCDKLHEWAELIPSVLWQWPFSRWNWVTQCLLKQRVTEVVVST